MILPGDDFIKRVVGLPGEYVQLIDGYFYINGKKLEETYINANYTEQINGFEWKLADNQYFLVGDNSCTRSKDSVGSLVLLI